MKSEILSKTVILFLKNIFSQDILGKICQNIFKFVLEILNESEGNFHFVIKRTYQKFLFTVFSRFFQVWHKFNKDFIPIRSND